ncbi:MAG TPA: type II secretion system F family protein [Anaerolineales bacterium]|nr:type II secretion system F family protein [Anaerolineales bacterium]HLO29500.1 type II secretion system F family protein [Anaerolineales bacterium]
MGLLIFGAVVLIGAIAVIVISLRRNAQGEEDDPLQARLAEFIQRGDVTSLEEIELSQPFSERVIVPVIRRLGEFSARFTPQKAIQDTAKRLELAGNPWPIDAATFLAIRFILAVVLGGFLVAVVLISPPSNPSDNFMYIGGATFAGFFLPHLMLTSRITRRQKEIRKAMPDALDLLTICVEAGLGFDAAMSKVSEKWENELSLAFTRTIREIQLGKVRREALKDMSDRLGIPEMTSFVAAIIQSEQLGVSLAKVLRIQSDQMRVKRRQHAEEEAHKAPIKMIIPMALLIFPSIIIIILTPAMIQILASGI